MKTSKQDSYLFGTIAWGVVIFLSIIALLQGFIKILVP
jgi:hypothetical protein